MIIQGFVVLVQIFIVLFHLKLQTDSFIISIIIPFTIKARDRTSHDRKTLNQSNYFSQFMF